MSQEARKGPERLGGAGIAPKSALVVVDVQNDFCDGGALAVPRAAAVVPVLNDWIARFEREGGPVYLTRDWHPRETSHFKERGGVWPVHCVKDSDGARFHPSLRIPGAAIVVSKGTAKDEDAYSGFQGRTAAGDLLAIDLRKRGVRHLVVGGLATDYCVKATVLDARGSGFDVSVLLDGIAGVDARPGDSDRAIAAMKAAGARFVASRD